MISYTASMLTGIIFIIIVGLLWGAIGVLFSKVVQYGVKPAAFHLVAFAVMSVCLLISHLDWPVLLAGVPRAGEVSLLMLASGALNTAGMILMMVAMKRGHQGITWTIGQSAMVIPFLASVVIWHDAVPLLKFAGVGCVLCTLAVLGLAKQPQGRVKNDGVWLAMALSVLVMVGIAQTGNSIPSRWAGWSDPANLRVTMMTLGALVIAAVFSLVQRIRLNRPAIVLGLLAGALSIASQVLLFKALDLLEGAGILFVAFPLAVGVCIVSFALYSGLVLKEHFGIREIAGIVLGLAGVGMMAVN